MKQKNRKMKQKLAMALSLLLIAGSTAGAMPMQVMAENDTIVSGDNTFNGGNISDDTAASGEQEVDAKQADVPVDSEGDAADLYPEEGEAYQTAGDAKQAAEVSYSTDGGSTWEQDDLCNVFWKVMGKKSVEIKLLRDITLESSWYPQPLAYKDQTVTLDGNGHTIARTGDRGIIVVSQPGSKLILKNITIDGGAVWSKGSPAECQNSGISSGGNDHLFWVYDGGTFILEEGAVLKNSHLTGEFYGAVQVGNSGSVGTFVMKSGSEIRDCAAKGGAAVNIDRGGVFRMEGGKIYNNYASVYGGSGVNCYGSFSMSGGEINGNTADNLGGGVCVMGSGVASMSGGSISGNHSKKYGGGVGIRDEGSFSMSGGSITGNTSESSGGGVFVYQGQMTVEGNPVITGNTMRGAANNLYLLSGRKVTISGALGESADIGVTADEGVISSGWNGQMAAAKIAGAYFGSDREELTIDKDTASGEVKLSARGDRDKGSITEEVKKGENAPEIKVPVWPEGLEDTILKDAEKKLVANGENVVIRLVVADAENSTDERDKAVVEAELNGSTMGQYLDISLLKIIGGGKQSYTRNG